jgi:hypothetical protein
MSTAISSESHTHRPASGFDLPPELDRQLRSDCRKLTKLMARHHQSHLQGFYDIGQFVQEACDRFNESQEAAYGFKIIDRLAEAAGIHSRTVYHCHRLVKLFDEAEYAALIVREGITWTHIIHLLNVDQKSTRAKLAEQMETQGWTPDDLLAEVRRVYGPRRAGSGRKPAIPQTVPQALRRLLGLATKSHNALSAALFCDDYDLACELDELPPENVTPGIREQVALAIGAIKQLSADLAKAAPRLERALPVLDQMLAEKANQEPACEEDE